MLQYISKIIQKLPPWSPVWSFHNHGIFREPCHLLILIHHICLMCQCNSVTGHFRALLASLCWQASKRCWVYVPNGLGTYQHYPIGNTAFDWPENSPNQNQKIHRLSRETWSTVNLSAIKQTWTACDNSSVTNWLLN